MITLSKLLKDPVFKSANVVAGAAGLEQPVEWSHIIDVPEVIEMVGPGRNLIITTGQGLPHDPQAQTRFVAELAQAGLAGIIISVGGKFFQTVPPAFLAAAEVWNFPVITVPREIPFVKITRTIHEQLISQHYAMLKRSDHIHQRLTHIVLEGGGLQELAEALTELVNRAVTIEDPSLNLLAYAKHGESDIARQKSIETGGTPELIRNFVKEQGILSQLQHSLKPTIVPAWPEHGMTKERIVSPIMVEREIYGYLWLIAGDEPLSEADAMTIERAAIVAALIMLKDTTIKQTVARLQADVVSQLLSKHPHSLALADKANRLGLDLEQAQRVILLRPPAGVLPSLRLADKFMPVVRDYTSNLILQPLGQNLILILPDHVYDQTLGRALLERLPEMKIGIGAVAPTLTDLAQSYEQAKEALEIGLMLNGESRIFKFEELGFLHWLYHLPPQATTNNRYADWVKILATDERAARAQLLYTLEIFLDCGGNAAETARVLGIHRNTLAYRLKQIETCCQTSLTEPETRLNLQIAIKSFHLTKDSAES